MCIICIICIIYHTCNISQSIHMLPLKRKAVTLKTCTVFPVSGVVPSIVRTTFTYDSHDGDADDVDIFYVQYAFAFEV